MELDYTSAENTAYYVLTGGGVSIARYEYSYEDGYEDPDTSE